VRPSVRHSLQAKATIILENDEIRTTMKHIEKHREADLDTDWINADIAWQNANTITLGIDVGSVSTQAVIVADDAIFAYSNLRGGVGRKQSAERALSRLFEKTDLPEKAIQYCVGTGYGRVSIPFSDKTVTEISCIARGAKYMFGPSIRSVLDVGGQDIKMIHCDEQGKVVHFHMNDKCGAGTGRGIETIAELLEIPLNQTGKYSSPDNEKALTFSSKCVIYARSEAIKWVRAGIPKAEVFGAFCEATAQNMMEVVKKIGIIPRFALTGGLAKIPGVVNQLVSKLEIEPLYSQWDPQIAGALGAALFARTLVQKGKKRKHAAS
jgi:benzoyl-CoA reductase subunit A